MRNIITLEAILGCQRMTLTKVELGDCCCILFLSLLQLKLQAARGNVLSLGQFNKTFSGLFVIY